MVGVIEAPTVEKGAPAVTKTAPLRRVKRLERPNLSEHEENIGKLHAEMDGLHARVREIKTILDNKQQSRGVQSPVQRHTFDFVVDALSFHRWLLTPVFHIGRK